MRAQISTKYCLLAPLLWNFCEDESLIIPNLRVRFFLAAVVEKQLFISVSAGCRDGVSSSLTRTLV